MKRYLKITQESAFGTPAATSIWIRLPSANNFQVMTKPVFWDIMSGNGFAVPALRGTQQSTLAATLTTPLTATQAQFLLGWCGTRINGAQTSPWTTTELAGDLASCQVEYAFTNFDGTLRYQKANGVKVSSWGLTASKDSQPVMLTMNLVGGTPTTGTTLAEPADTVFPTDPYLFQHLRGGFSIAGSRTNFESFSVQVENRLKAYFDESQYANAIRLGGRRTTIGGRFRLKASPDDRPAYEAATAKSVTLTLTGYSHTAVITANAQNFFDSLSEDFPPDEEIYYDATLLNMLDTSATTDFTLSFT